MLGGKGRKVFDLPGAVGVGRLCLVFCWFFFFNNSLKHLAIPELQNLKRNLQ